ncbi:MAG: VOC family protein [Candidatus Promineifilaceae bacterium]|nr:VOC family protein [Candidatus Promineifilaceae bacterium]
MSSSRSISLPDATTVGPVALTVADLERSLDFYGKRLGFQLQERDDGRAALGTGSGQPLLYLHKQPGARRRPTRSTGLYHYAILFPSRRDLARALLRLAQTGTAIQGASDHLVSEAIYLADPDGNGIEIYRDRPRSEWPRRNGQIEIGTVALDMNDLLSVLPDEKQQPEAAEHYSLPAGTTIGHVHLHVSDLQRAEQFYRDVVGLELIMHYGNAAAFLSAGGYHHHLGLNTWAGTGAPPPPEDAVGLRWYAIRVPDAASRSALLERLQEAGVPLQAREMGVLFHDPAQNPVLLLEATGGTK